MGLPVGRRTEAGPALQAFRLKHHYPDSTVKLKARRLVWNARVTPLPGSGTYSLQLEAEPGKHPFVYVTEPALVPDESGRLPHVYDNGSICVAKPGDWERHMLFIDTFVPWSLEWLVYYELWRATGIWLGDGADRTDPASQARILHPYTARSCSPAGSK